VVTSNAKFAFSSVQTNRHLPEARVIVPSRDLRWGQTIVPKWSCCSLHSSHISPTS